MSDAPITWIAREPPAGNPSAKVRLHRAPALSTLVRRASDEDTIVVPSSRLPALCEAAVKRGEFEEFRPRVLVVGEPDAASVSAVRRELFVGRLFDASPFVQLPREELDAALTAPDVADRFVAAAIDPVTGWLLLVRGDLRTLRVPLASLEPGRDGTRPELDALRLTDFGHTVALGEWEAASDALLYEHDPAFRRALRAKRNATERSLGASIRRLRLQRRLRQTDFRPSLGARELGRIERGEIRRPHASTLSTIATRLGVSVHELADF